MFFKILLCFLSVLFFVESQECPSHIEKEVWDKVTPYLLPHTHPIKVKLDKLFSHSRAILNLDSLTKAGFKAPKIRKWTHLLVLKHSSLNGFIIKAYLDTQRYPKGIPEYEYWIKRIQGARKIQKTISKNKWDEDFKVPKKYIYCLPKHPSPPDEYLRKNFILVEEDMDILSQEENITAWQGPLITKSKLKKLHTILDKHGLKDCAKIDNIPLSKDGKIAFIDTQSHEEWPVPFKRLTPCLHQDLQKFWKSLID